MGAPAADSPLIAQLQAYQARLRAAGKLIEARTVARCIRLARQAQRPPA